MTGDRRLKPHEVKVFIQQGKLGIDTIREMFFVGGEPSLFDVAFIEIIASLEAHREIITNQEARINVMQKEIEVLNSLESKIRIVLQELKILDDKLEEHKQVMIDQIEEMKKMMEKFENAE